MDLAAKKEQFSNAVLQAVAATAGYKTSKPNVDDDSIDWTLSSTGGGGTVRSPKIDLQLKSTAVPDWHEDVLHFDLEVKNFNDLVPTDLQCPRILVVVVVPVNVAEWLEMDHESTTVRRCAYWLSLRGEQPTNNDFTKTVHLPRANRFDAAALTAMMGRVANGAPP